MPLSMRRQTAQMKKAKLKQEARIAARTRAIEIIRNEVTKDKRLSNRKIASITSVPLRTVNVLRNAVQHNNKGVIEQYLSSDTRAGKRRVLTNEEEAMIVQKIKSAALRGAAIGYEGLKYMMTRIASDGREGFPHNTPSNDTIRAFRARHREITYRATENKEVAKLNAERKSHVQPFFDIIADIGGRNEGLLTDGSRIWNLDETSVDFTYGKREKSFTSSGSNHGGFKKCKTLYSSNKHISALVAVSAAGHKTPPFFIIQGKKINVAWFNAVPGSAKKGGKLGICSKFLREGWFPAKTAVIKMSTNGSMEMDILESAIKHIARNIREIVGNAKVILTLDGHASRNGVGWIEECRRQNIEAVIAPANTSHILQPCDKRVNKKFKSAGRTLRDAFLSIGNFDHRQVSFNLACAIHAFDAITSADIIESFRETGLFPFERNFGERFADAHQNNLQRTSQSLERLEQAGGNSTLQSVFKRKSDTTTLSTIKDILNSSHGPSRTIQKISLVLRNAETANSILHGEAGEDMASVHTAVSQTLGKSPHELADPGAAAECVTIAEVLDRRKSILEAKRQEEEEKMRRKEDNERKRKEKALVQDKARERALADREERKRKRIEEGKIHERERGKKRRRALEKKELLERKKIERKRRKLQESSWREHLVKSVLEGIVREASGRARGKKGALPKGRAAKGVRVAAAIVVELVFCACSEKSE